MVVKSLDYISNANVPQYILSTIVHPLFDNQRLISSIDGLSELKYLKYLDSSYKTRSELLIFIFDLAMKMSVLLQPKMHMSTLPKNSICRRVPFY